MPRTTYSRLKRELRPWHAAAFIALAAGLAYRNSFGGRYIFDDSPSIADNPTIRHLASALSPPGGGVTVSGRPLLNLSFAVNYAIGGAASWGYHAVNLLIHILAGWTLFGIVRRTLMGTDRSRSRKTLAVERSGQTDSQSLTTSATENLTISATIVAFAAALLWTVHPLQTESVTYVVQRAESLMGLFYLLTIYCFVRGAEKHEVGRVIPNPPENDDERGRSERRVKDNAPYLWHSLSVLACLFGMATKEAMATAPLVVLAYDRTFIAGTAREAWRRRRAYYLALASGWILLGFLAAHTGNRGGTVGFIPGLHWVFYWLTQFSALLRYLRLALWPHPLVIDYGLAGAGDLPALISAIVVVGALGAATIWAVRKKGPAAAFGFLGFCFFIILAPTSLVPGGRQTIAEHRMYLPLAAVTVAGAVALWTILGRSPLRYLGTILVIAGGLGLITVRRNAEYRDPLALWVGAVEERPDNGFAHDDLGTAWHNLGNIPAAAAEYKIAVRLLPGYSQAHYNLGNALEKLRDLPGAAAQFEQAVRLNPGLQDAYNHLGNISLRLGRVGEALAQFQVAVRLDPTVADWHNNLAVALATAGRRPEAQKEFAAALALDPRSFPAHMNLGNLWLQSGQLREARAQFEEALRLDPGSETASRAAARVDALLAPRP